MGTFAYTRRILLGLCGSLFALSLLAAATRAHEVPVGTGAAVGAGATAVGFVIHDVDETLKRYCSWDAEGRLWFELPGLRCELVTSTTDPSIANPGDGAFHPFEPAEVKAALADVRYPLDRVGADVFILPYPRRGALESAAGPRLILLSPGVRAVPREHQHSVFVHELGHIVQYQLLPDTDAGRWSAYRRLRGIEDLDEYRASSVHAERPHEIFAEDFRALFGGSVANYSGTVENAALTYPSAVAGLESFVWGLSNVPVGPGALTVWPNPSRGPVTFSRVGLAAAPLDLFDAAGRRIASLEPVAFGGTVQWPWDGRDGAGRLAGPGVLFARARDARDAALRIARVR